MYEYLNTVLANHLTVLTEFTIAEALSSVRENIAFSPQFSEGLRTDIQNALNDKAFSWKAAFIEHQCELLYTDDETEEEVRAYAKKILWDELFAT